jgi:hypothetical protein
LLAADSTAKLNKQLQKPPLKGKIITIEQISTIKTHIQHSLLRRSHFSGDEKPLGYK